MIFNTKTIPNKKKFSFKTNENINKYLEKNPKNGGNAALEQNDIIKPNQHKAAIILFIEISFDSVNPNIYAAFKLCKL